MKLLQQRASALLMAGVLATLAAAAPAALAGAPQVRTQAPGYYRMMLGAVEVTALSDGTHPFPVTTVMTHVTQAQVEAGLQRDALTLPVQGSINAFLINTGHKLILIDSGAGVLYGACCGQLMSNLRAAGYQPEQVDEVLLTHLHKDHVGGINADGHMAFPNAIVRSSQAEADYWLNPANKAGAPALLSSFFDSAAASVAPYLAAGRFRPFKPGGQLEAGIRTMAEPGHTPGHTVYQIEAGGQTMLVWGDIIHLAAVQLQDPDASVEYDSDAAAAQTARRTLLQLAAQRHYLVGAAHIAFPGLGHLRADGAGYDWLPLNYDAAPGQH